MVSRISGTEETVLDMLPLGNNRSMVLKWQNLNLNQFMRITGSVGLDHISNHRHVVGMPEKINFIGYHATWFACCYTPGS